MGFDQIADPVWSEKSSRVLSPCFPVRARADNTTMTGGRSRRPPLMKGHRCPGPQTYQAVWCQQLFIVRGMHQEPPIASNFAAGTLQVYGGIAGDDLKLRRGSNS